MWHSIELTVFNVACFLSVSCSHLEFLGGGGMLLLSPERSGPCGHLLLSLASSWRCSVVSVTEGGVHFRCSHPFFIPFEAHRAAAEWA